MPLGNALQALIMLAVVLIGSVSFGNLFRRSNLLWHFDGYNSGPHSSSHKVRVAFGDLEISHRRRGPSWPLVTDVPGRNRAAHLQQITINPTVTPVATGALCGGSDRRLRSGSLALRAPTRWPTRKLATCMVIRRCGAERHGRSRSCAPHPRSRGTSANPRGRATNCRHR